MIEMSNKILTEWPENDYRFYLRHSGEEDMKYGLPDKKKYPMPDRDHVMSAIKFFNYVSPSDEKELAKNILKRIREYGIEDINVGENNRFGKYYNSDGYLVHHGIPGMRWGVRRYQNADGSLTNKGQRRYSSLANKMNKAKAKLGKLESKRNTPKYLNNQAKIEKYENKIEKRQIKNQKIRDKKMFDSKDPSFLGKRSLKKEIKLSKKLHRLNRKNRVLEISINKTNARINKYQRLLDNLTA